MAVDWVEELNDSWLNGILGGQRGEARDTPGSASGHSVTPCWIRQLRFGHYFCPGRLSPSRYLPACSWLSTCQPVSGELNSWRVSLNSPCPQHTPLPRSDSPSPCFSMSSCCLLSWLSFYFFNSIAAEVGYVPNTGLSLLQITVMTVEDRVMWTQINK